MNTEQRKELANALAKQEKRLAAAKWLVEKTGITIETAFEVLANQDAVLEALRKEEA